MPSVGDLIPYLHRIDEVRTYSNGGPLCRELQERLSLRFFGLGVNRVTCVANGTLAFYFARELDFSESYIRIYSLDLQEAKASFANSEESVRSQYFDIFDKANAVSNILRSLYFLQKKAFADQLVAAYRLDEKFSWLDEARTCVLFRKPDYCGYAI